MDDNLNKELNEVIIKVNQEYQDIRYGIYRVALKLCKLQEIFKLERVGKLSVIDYLKTFISNKTGKVVDAISEERINIHELQMIIEDLFKLSGEKLTSQFLRVQKMLTMLIFETYEDLKMNQVSLLPVALFLIVMGNEELKTKYKLIFELYSGNVRMLTKSRTGLLLTHFVRITDIVGESGNFSKVSPAVQSCFEGILGSAISEQQLLRWLFREPQSVVWLPTMHRLNIGKNSIHQVQCATCKVRPIVGLRFQCLRCLDYDSCQTCFLTQQNAARSHRLDHPRQEYCLPAGGKEKVNAFARTLRNIVTKRYKRKSLSSSFLPIHQTEPIDELMEMSADFEDVNHLADEEKRNLEHIVSELKKENMKISGTVEMLEASKTEVTKLDEERLILQNEVDVLNLHNQSLQNELDNLKCVVFSDNFINGGFDEHFNSGVLDVSEDNLYLSSEEEPRTSEQNVSNAQLCSVSQDFTAMGENRNFHNSSGNKMKPVVEFSERKAKAMQGEEGQLHHLVEMLTTSMDLSNIPQEKKTTKEMLLAAEKLEHQLCELIDCAIDIGVI